MADGVFRFPPTPPAPPPKNILRQQFFAVIGRGGRPMVCSSHEVETGLELRIGYSGDDVMRSELFRGNDREERLRATAETWRLALIEKGFTEVDV